MSQIDIVIRRLEAAKGAIRIEERLGHVDVALVVLRAVRVQIVKAAAGDDANQGDLFAEEEEDAPARPGVTLTAASNGVVLTPADTTPARDIRAERPEAFADTDDAPAASMEASERAQRRTVTMVIEALAAAYERGEEGMTFTALAGRVACGTKATRLALDEVVAAGTVAAGKRGSTNTTIYTYVPEPEDSIPFDEAPR